MAIRLIPTLAAGGLVVSLLFFLHNSGPSRSDIWEASRAVKQEWAEPAICPAPVVCPACPPITEPEPVEVQPSRFDPLSTPGWVGSSGWWEPADEDLANPHIYEALIESQAKGGGPSSKVDWIVGKKILFLGDSIIRDIMMRFCFHMGNPDPSLTECRIPELQLNMVSIMLHGFVDYYKEPKLTDMLSVEWPPNHLDFETRIKLASGLMSDPDVVIVNGGAWDFKYMFQRDVYLKKNHKTLSDDDMQVYRDRSKLFFELLREEFPTQKIFWVQLHTFSSDDGNAKAAWTSGKAQSGRSMAPAAGQVLPDLFTPLRINQLSQIYRQAAEDAGYLDTLDYFKISNSFTSRDFIRPGDAIHPAEGSIKAITDVLWWKLWHEETFGDD